MTRYWWVNHKQTFEHEINGGYVWAPKVKRDGRRSHFYDNLRLASPGDVVISFANATIRHVGTVSDYALSSPKPDTFGNAGDAWSDDGWMLPVIWRPLMNSVKPTSFSDELRLLLREKYAPLQSTGRGNQGAYFSEIDESLLNLVLFKSATSLNLLFASASVNFDVSSIGEEIDEILEQQLVVSKSLSDTDKIQLIKARRGQGIFRANVQQYEFACRVTGVESRFLLVASHIKPWRSCINSHERLDGNNGLLLTPHVDRLFDRGYITFNGSGNLIISSKIEAENVKRLGISVERFSPFPFPDEKQKYLEYHRQNVFLE